MAPECEAESTKVTLSEEPQASKGVASGGHRCDSHGPRVSSVSAPPLALATEVWISAAPVLPAVEVSTSNVKTCLVTDTSLA